MRIDDDDVKDLLEELDKSVNSPKSTGFHTEEILDGLNRIAVSSANKQKLFQQGILNQLKDVFFKSKEMVAKIAAAKLIWNLAFSDENRRKMKNHKPLMMGKVSTIYIDMLIK